MERKRNPVKTITWKDITSLAEEVAVLLCKINTNRHLIAKASNAENQKAESKRGIRRLTRPPEQDPPSQEGQHGSSPAPLQGQHHPGWPERVELQRGRVRQPSLHVPKARPTRSLTPL